MDERLKTNLAKWNALVPVHARSKMYDLAGFKAGRISLHELEVAEIGDVRGKSLLHLQCHFGLDTMSWARLGAAVTGLDFSGEAIKLARSLSGELEIPARFICADIYDARSAVDGKFDVVFTSYGAITWLPNMRRWAQVIANSLKPGGFFYIADQHPFAIIFNNEDDAAELGIQYPYFREDMIVSSGGKDYADPAYLNEHNNAEWIHTVDSIVNSLIEAGLQIEFFREHSSCPWRMFPFCEPDGRSGWHIKGDLIPLIFSLKARKP
ncbi:MAG TPA: class I SAM-dependent methyltransferase [Candidatus Binataceae bacterium]